MPKFTTEESRLIESIVARMSIKRIPDSEIITEIQRQTDKKITRQTVYNARQRIKKESYHWYKTMREGQYEYIHEFKERLDEIIWLQKKHYQIIDSNPDNPQIQLSSMAELHRLNITLSNYFDVAPSIINDSTLSITPQSKAAEPETDFIV